VRQRLSSDPRALPHQPRAGPVPRGHPRLRAARRPRGRPVAVGGAQGAQPRRAAARAQGGAGRQPQDAARQRARASPRGRAAAGRSSHRSSCGQVHAHLKGSRERLSAAAKQSHRTWGGGLLSGLLLRGQRSFRGALAAARQAPLCSERRLLTSSDAVARRPRRCTRAAARGGNGCVAGLAAGRRGFPRVGPRPAADGARRDGGVLRRGGPRRLLGGGACRRDGVGAAGRPLGALQLAARRGADARAGGARRRARVVPARRGGGAGAGGGGGAGGAARRGGGRHDDHGRRKVPDARAAARVPRDCL